MDIICGSWWCNNHVTKEIRKIDGIIVCRACYAHVWEWSKKLNLPLEVAFRRVSPPKKTPVHKHTRCFRRGCETILTPEMGSDKYRFIDSKKPVCRNCHEAIWEYKEKHGLSSMEEAFNLIPPKGWKPPPKVAETTVCYMPWCENSVKKGKHSLLGGEAYVCGKCRTYLNILSRRIKPIHDWKWYALEVLQGKAPAPGTPEICAARWCGVEIKGKVRQRGPNGEPLCTADVQYFANYAKKYQFTFEKAFKTAPGPSKILQTRGKQRKKRTKSQVASKEAK